MRAILFLAVVHFAVSFVPLLVPIRIHTAVQASSQRDAGLATKRQSRVSHLVRTTLAPLIHNGLHLKTASTLPSNIRQSISLVAVDVSPDLRQARVTCSVASGPGVTEVEKRRAFAWLSENSRSIRHAMAQRLSHMKRTPELTFVGVDVGGAVDVMHLIDKIQGGYKRDVDLEDELAGMYENLDFDELDDEDDEDDGFDEDDFEE